MSRLIALGSGLLLGAGLGIIIPEYVPSTHFASTDLEPAYSRGVEAVIEANKSGASSRGDHFPAMTIAVSLLVGFTFMLITEQLIPGAHSHSGPHIHGSSSPSPKGSTIEFDADVELGELEDSSRSPHPTAPRPASTSAQRPTTPRTSGDGFTIPLSGKGLTLTLGLVLHALSDGLALGSSIVSDPGSQDLSLVIFAALAIHKGMATPGVRTMIKTLNRMVYSTDCARSDNLFTGERGKSSRLQEIPRNLQRFYTHRCSPHLPFPVVLPLCGWG